MKPEEKAKQLIEKFTKHCNGQTGSGGEKYSATQCALICVDEIIKMEDEAKVASYTRSAGRYWGEVKDQICKLYETI